MRAKGGLTLVELLVSLAIVTMLLVAALGVTVSLARSELAVRKEAGGAEHLTPAMENLLKADLVHAHHHRGSPDTFSVQTNASLVARTLRLEHVPAVVTYQVRKVGQRPCLFRIQETPPDPAFVELVAAGVRTVRFVPGKDVQPSAEGWRPMAGGCAVRLEIEQAGLQPAVIEVRVPEDRSN